MTASPTMTSVRDFQTPSRVRSGSSGDSPQSPVQTTSRVNTAHRPSNASYASVNTAGLRHRRPTRSNTVKAYHESEHPTWQPGAEPGIDPNAEDDAPHLVNLHTECQIDVIDFSADSVSSCEADNSTLQDALLEPRPEDLPCRWICVNGLSWDVIKFLARKYKLHRLAVEDLTITGSRTKVDWYSDHAFIVLTLQKLVRVHSQDDHDDCDSSHNGAAGPADPSMNGHGGFKAKWGKDQDASNGHVLPRYERKDPADKINDFVNAHSSTSLESPVKPIRTLHRYEGSQNPEHTVYMEKHSALAEEDLVVSVEQVGIFLMADNTVISFFEHSSGDVQGPIMNRLQSEETMLRRNGDASLLVQAIIDGIVDLAMPVKDAYNKARKDLQIDVLTNPDIETAKSLHIFTEEIDMLQNLFKPIVNLVNALRDHNSESLGNPSISAQDHTKANKDAHHKSDKSGQRGRTPLKRTLTTTSVVITPLAHTYFGDVLDHCITIIQSLEQMDASANNLSSLIFNTVGANTNNFMMILALVTVFFSPLTFISGYFGMNFTRFTAINVHSDAFFWYVSIPSVIVFMLAVGGQIMLRTIKNWFAKLHIQKGRRQRTKERKASGR